MSDQLKIKDLIAFLSEMDPETPVFRLTAGHHKPLAGEDLTTKLGLTQLSEDNDKLFGAFVDDWRNVEGTPRVEFFGKPFTALVIN